MQKTRLTAIVSGLVLVSFILYVQVFSPTRVSFFLKRLDHIVYDLSLSVLSKQTKLKSPIPIVIVDVDEASLKQIGRWPWPRKVMARLVERLFSSGAILVGFDIIFSGQDDNPAEAVLQKLHTHSHPDAKAAYQVVKSLVGEFKSDDVLAQAITGRDVVMGFYLNEEKSGSIGSLPDNALDYDSKKLEGLLVKETKNYVGNLARLQQAAPLAGFTTSLPDEDGVVRRVPLILKYQNKLYGNFALEMAKAYLLLNHLVLKTVRMGELDTFDRIVLGDTAIPTDALGNMLIPYVGGSRTFTYIAAKDILQDHVNTRLLDNSIVLIGATASSLGDLHNTPLENEVYPGVEIQASILQAILSKHFLWQPAWHDGFMIAFLLFLGLIGALVFPYLSAIRLVLTSALLFILILGLQYYLLFDTGIVINSVKPLLLVLLLMLFNLAYGFLFESRKRLRIKRFFEQYVPEAHIEKMTAQEKTDWLAGESRMMSVLFCDISHFTDISETLSAKQVKQYLNHVFTPITKIIFDYQGTIDKYMGDLVMAFWGAPLSDPEYVEHGLRALLAIREKAVAISADLKSLGFPAVHFTVGYHTGEMYVGDMGSEYRRAYTVLGDTVNLASRLQMLCGQYGVDSIVSEGIKIKCPSFVFKILDRVCVKGKQVPVTIYEPVGLLSELSCGDKDTLMLMEQAYDHYCAQHWDEAKRLFQQLQRGDLNNPLYSLYLSRIVEYRQQNLPKDWNGVTILTHK